MTWLIGIDEAGYGPNLGPLVMTLVACRVPEAGHVDLWDRLAACIRRHEEPADGRAVVGDSKQVYSTARGLADLEHSVLTALGAGACAAAGLEALSLHGLLEILASAHVAELIGEPWYVGDTALPVRAPMEGLAAAARRLGKMSRVADVTWGCCRSAIVCAPRFNTVVERWDSKAVVVGLALVQLIRTCLEHTSAEPMIFAVDKLGGRNQYSVLLQEAFSPGLVLVDEEGAERSHYHVRGLGREVQITFLPRADSAHFTVALASMVSKYVRELLMLEFNRFWQQHVPGLRATAGYPGDASRYFDEIRPTLTKLGLSERQVWRCR